MRGDVRRASRVAFTRDCPDCDGEQLHTRYGEYPAVLTSGAWGKYLNPVYLCHGCQRTHTLLVYETDQEADRPEWGPYPPNQADDRHLTPKQKIERATSEIHEGAEDRSA